MMSIDMDPRPVQSDEADDGVVGSERRHDGLPAGVGELGEVELGGEVEQLHRGRLDGLGDVAGVDEGQHRLNGGGLGVLDHPPQLDALHHVGGEPAGEGRTPGGEDGAMAGELLALAHHT